MAGTKENSSRVVGKVKVSRTRIAPSGSVARVTMLHREAWALCGAIAKAAASNRRLELVMFGGSNGSGKTVFICKPKKA